MIGGSAELPAALGVDGGAFCACRWQRWRARVIALLLVPLAALLAISSVHAHKPSDSYLTLRVADARVEGQWDIALRDLEFAIGLDANGDGEITWAELKARHDEIAAYALARLELRSDLRACPMRATGHLVDQHSDGAYAVLRFEADCAAQVRDLDARYRLFFDFDAQHKGLLRLESSLGTQTGVFSADRSIQRFELAAASVLAQFVSFLREGIWHIWIGADHVLFVLSLLLPAVLVYELSRWKPASRFAPAFWDVVKVVTSFTVAHSITLSLAALGVISLPSRLVESAIAASVVLAASNNLYPVVLGRRWIVAFFFGLVHGFGFASVLADLGLPQNALLLALLGFNLGVEVGQLVIVTAFVPFAFALRATVFYRLVIVAGGSALVTLIALLWFAERAFKLELIPL